MSNILKVSKKDTIITSKVRNKDTRTTSGTTIVNFKHISHFILLLM